MASTTFAVPVRLRPVPDPTDIGIPESADDVSVGHLSPDADLIEYPDAHELLVELPGLAAPEIDVALTDRALVVSAVKPDPEMASCAALARHLTERRYGAIRRSFALPPGTDRTAVRASMENGLLTVVLPKARGARRA